MPLLGYHDFMTNAINSRFNKWWQQMNHLYESEPKPNQKGIAKYSIGKEKVKQHISTPKFSEHFENTSNFFFLCFWFVIKSI